ncbi:MAG: cysteine--tRNA ligase [Limnochordaceae bacterium]|nr:cysteine--tRNA ligase [Limnochordaceae bacterium]
MRVYNTLTRRQEEFVPREPGRVSIYVCGLTPYDHAHLGHLRPAVVWQTIRNYLEYKGFQVTLVQNFTDIDDKIIDRAHQTGMSAEQLARTFIQDYLNALDRMGLQFADRYPRVTRHISRVIAMVEELVRKGHAYVVDGNVYFDVTTFAPYGKLSGQRAEELEAGARVEVDERKRHAGDFALWKAAKPGEPSWDSPWGPGRPGWHIECSAMSLDYLGFGFDFHGGGSDLIFPHHENEIAQSEAYEGREGFVRYWLHNGLINVRAEKMSKSLGNFTTAREILSRYPGTLVKFYLLSTHYRSPLEFTPSSLDEVRPGWQRLNQAFQRLSAFAPCLVGLGRQPAERWLEDALPVGWQGEDEAERRALAAVHSVRDAFEEAMDDDFNTARALGVVFEFVRDVNPLLERIPPPGECDAGAPSQLVLAAAYALMRSFAMGILGVIAAGAETAAGRQAGPAAAGREQLVDALVQLILDLRQKARGERRYAEADEMRRALEQLGFVVEDTPSGVRWRLREGAGKPGA